MRERLQEGSEFSNREVFRILGRAFRYLAPFRGRFVAKTLLLIVSLLPMLFLPWPVKIVVDHVVLGTPIGEQATPYPGPLALLVAPLEGRTPVEILFVMAGVQLALVLLIGAVGTGGAERDQTEAYLAGGHDSATRTENEANAGFSMTSGLLGLFDVRFTIRLTQALNHYYRSRLFERIQSLPMTAFDDERIGDAIYRVMYDTPAITNSIYRIVLTPIGSTVIAISTVLALQATYGSHPPIVWTAVAMLFLALFATAPFSALLRRFALRSRRAGATTTSTMEEGLTNMLAVQSLGGENRERERFADDSWGSFSRYRQEVALAMTIALCAMIPGFALASYAAYYVSNLVIEGGISVGDWSLIFTYFLILAFSCVEVGSLWIRVQASSVGLHRVFFLMDLPAEPERANAVAAPRLRDRVSIEHVSFAYPDGTPALRDVSFEARRGAILAIVGPAGSGKTTAASLIPRFVTPAEGVVCFDGRDVRDYTLESVRSQVAFVFQENVLFDDTVAGNIRLGRPDATDLEVRRAAELAGADEFIRRLPEGYETPLGRSGGKLSVGQKQRLSIARALVRDAAVLILDEPTSALDPATEQRLVETLREASGERAVVVIAHRLSTIRSADEILFLEEGRILERGSHEVLMSSEAGAYRRFVELQTRGAA